MIMGSKGCSEQESAGCHFGTLGIFFMLYGQKKTFDLEISGGHFVFAHKNKCPQG